MQRVKEKAAKAIISGVGLEPGIVVSPPESEHEFRSGGYLEEV